jgi:hypothetical protein
MEWLEKLQVPGLILAGAVIWLQFKDRERLQSFISQELAGHTRIMIKVATLLDLICKRTSEKRDGAR